MPFPLTSTRLPLAPLCLTVTLQREVPGEGVWMSGGKALGGGVSEGKAWHVLEQRGQSGWSRASEGMRGGGVPQERWTP